MFPSSILLAQDFSHLSAVRNYLSLNFSPFLRLKMLCSPSWGICDPAIASTSSASPIRSKFGSRIVSCRWRRLTSETPRSLSTCCQPLEVRPYYPYILIDKHDSVCLINALLVDFKCTSSCSLLDVFLSNNLLWRLFSAGTNINDAIQTGSSLLRDYLSGPDASPNSVSLIIFLTDGRPTVGEIQSTAILGNTRSASQEKFCIFTIGIGNDVDYRLLERMALENCGMMRRIPEEADASAMLKG